MSEGKKSIRKNVLKYRKLLSKEVFDQRNKLIVEKTIQFIAEHKISCMHSFLPIEKNNEVNTWPIIYQLKKDGIKVVLSATDFENEIMTHYWNDDSLIFENDQFGIPTPVNGQMADLNEVEMVLIPLLAADKKGNRIGYGKGYYDRLLARMNQKVMKIGLTLGPLFDHFSFAEPHDIGLDYCVTPKEIVAFKK